MTSKIKNIDVTYIKFGCFGIEKAVGVIHIKSGNSDIKKQPHTRKNANVTHSISERKSSENRN